MLKHPTSATVTSLRCCDQGASVARKFRRGPSFPRSSERENSSSVHPLASGGASNKNARLRARPKLHAPLDRIPTSQVLTGRETWDRLDRPIQMSIVGGRQRGGDEGGQGGAPPNLPPRSCSTPRSTSSAPRAIRPPGSRTSAPRRASPRAHSSIISRSKEACAVAAAAHFAANADALFDAAPYTRLRRPARPRARLRRVPQGDPRGRPAAVHLPARDDGAGGLRHPSRHPRGLRPLYQRARRRGSRPTSPRRKRFMRPPRNGTPRARPCFPRRCCRAPSSSPRPNPAQKSPPTASII